jgi:hypothetical protein
MDLFRFEKAQELGLNIRLEISNLVEQKRAPACCPDDTERVVPCTGERPSAMTKELTLDQVLGDRGAVERNTIASMSITNL